jgi:hypothetical protein
MAKPPSLILLIDVVIIPVPLKEVSRSPGAEASEVFIQMK